MQHGMPKCTAASGRAAAANRQLAPPLHRALQRLFEDRGLQQGEDQLGGCASGCSKVVAAPKQDQEKLDPATAGRGTRLPPLAPLQCSTATATARSAHSATLVAPNRGSSPSWLFIARPWVCSGSLMSRASPPEAQPLRTVDELLDGETSKLCRAAVPLPQNVSAVRFRQESGVGRPAALPPPAVTA